MDAFGILVVFVIVWWLVFFMTLPFGVKTPEKVEPGHAEGAPDRPRLAIKAVAATVIAAAVTGLITVAAAYDLIGFREFVSGP
ncbi:MAG: DUF1467 family protein [Alphaproteobacteria bacterium]